MRRVLCLWFPQLAIDRIERRETRSRELVFACVAESGGRVLVHAANARARAAGIGPGMALADARAVYPRLVTRPADPRADARLLKGVGRWMERYSPLVALAPPDGLFAETAGGAHLFGGEAEMLAGLVAELERFGMTVRVALADTPGCAYAMARHGGGCTIVDPGATRAALAPLPVAALRLDPDVCESCRRLGLKTIGDLHGLPRAALASRFGLATVTRLDQALGSEDEPLAHIRFPERLRESLAFAEPIAGTQAVEVALSLLLKRLCARLESEEKGVRLATFRIERVDGTCQELRIATARPNRAPDGLFRLFRDRLDGLDAGFGIERAHVEARRCEELRAAQECTLDETSATQVDAGLADRLINRFGHDRVLRPALAESHLPERAWVAFSAVDPPYGGSCVGSLSYAGSWSAAGAARPLRLFTPPEPAAVEVREPQRVLPSAIRWQGRVLELEPLSGPERIEPEWWHDDPAWRSGARDYWWARTAGGEHLWLFHIDAVPGGGAWFVHGLGG